MAKVMLGFLSLLNSNLPNNSRNTVLYIKNFFLFIKLAIFLFEALKIGKILRCMSLIYFEINQ